MNRTFLFLSVCIPGFLVLTGNQKSFACDQSHLKLDSAKSIGGGMYRIDFQVCIGGGFSPPDTAGANNYTVDFYFDIFGSGVTIAENTTADEYYPDELNSGQSADGCTNCRNACVFYGGLGSWWHDPSCTAGSGATCYSCPGPTNGTHCPDTLSCSNGAGTCLWYSSNDPCCNGGSSGSSCNASGFNYFSFWGIPFKPLSCPGPPNTGVGCRNWTYTDIWNGSGTAAPYCDTMYITTQGLPDSIVVRGVENTSGFAGDCWTSGDHPEQTINLSALPVYWSAISAEPGFDFVTIRWATFLEVNNSHFIVKKSLDGYNFFDLDRVEGTNRRQGYDNYEYVDVNPEPGTSFYKITQVDQDGKNSDSKTVSVTFTGIIHSHINSIFPVPAVETTTIFMYSAENQQFRVVIFDQEGKIALESTYEASAGENFLDLDVSALASGLYFFRLNSPNSSLDGKFLKY